MTPRPIHRWKTLWFGITVILFLGWAWEKSNSRMNAACWVHAATSEGLFLRNLPGTTQIEYTGPNHHIYPLTPAIQWYSNPRVYPEEWFPKPVFFEPFGNKGGWTLNLPHWLLILLFLIPWLAFLAWRSRRMHHLTESASSTEPAS